MKFEAITIKDIARVLELSTSTVSRALRGSHEISPETKKRVLEYAEQMNYRPNPVALSLRERKSKAIGVIVCEVANDFYSQTINGIESIAYNLGYHVIITQSHESYEREMVNLNHLASRLVDGLLVSVSTETTDMSHFKKLQDKGMPIVFFDRVPSEIITHKVTLNNYQAAYEATGQLIRAGYKKIAHLTSAAQLSITTERLAGFKAALKENGLVFNPEYVKYCSYGGMIFSEVEAAIRQLLTSRVKPDAIFVAADRLTAACLIILKQQKGKSSVTPGMIGFNNSSMMDLLEPRPAIVKQPAFEMGQVATELLMQIIESKRPVTDFETRILEAGLPTADHL